MEKTTVLNQLKTDIKMVKTLNMGDPIYIDNPEVQHICYKKNFRRPDWVGQITTKELAHEYEGMKYNSTDYVIILAADEMLLELFAMGRRYKYHSVKSYVMGVDTAEYIIETDTNFATISTGSDGVMGDILEFYKGNKLEGVVVELTADQYRGIKENHNILKLLFTEVNKA